MLPEFYKEFIQLCDHSLVEMLKIAKEMLASGVLEDIELYQNIIIEFGNILENQYGMEDTKPIHCLEESCEVLYEVASGEKTIRQGGELLIDLLTNCGRSIKEIKKCRERHTSVVLIAKGEERYIEEWLDYHILVGIDHFYIYDNGSSDLFRKLLQPYIYNGYVTYIWFPGEKKQYDAYNHALKHYCLDTRYMAFIDGDEFLISTEGRKIPDVVDEIIDNYNELTLRVAGDVGGIGINWRNYGTSKLEKRTEDFVIETHVLRAEDKNIENVHIKSIVNPRVADHFQNSPHACRYKKGYFNISENGSYIPDAFFYDSHCEKLRINHYYMKSTEEYMQKVERGWPCWNYQKLTEEAKQNLYMAYLEPYNQIEDPVLVPFADKIREFRKNEMRYSLYDLSDFDIFCDFCNQQEIPANNQQEKKKADEKSFGLEILDVGMVMKRLGMISRQDNDRQIAQDVNITGVDFLDGDNLPIYHSLYNTIEHLESWTRNVAKNALPGSGRAVSLLHVRHYVTVEQWNLLIRFALESCEALLLHEDDLYDAEHFPTKEQREKEFQLPKDFGLLCSRNNKKVSLHIGNAERYLIVTSN